MLRRFLRQLWMTRLHDPEEIDALLRHPALRDRAPLENALSRVFFAPFVHQEVVAGERFEARSAWSRAALAAMPVAHALEVAGRAFERHARPGSHASLLDEVRRVSASAALELAAGSTELDDLVLPAVKNFDECIKMMGARDAALRRRLRNALRVFLGDPSRWRGTSYLTLAREQALALPLDDRVDHFVSVFLGTGAIQISDVVTHALVALAQHPAARAAEDARVVAETIRVYPVNASLTRLVSDDVSHRGKRLRRGDAVTVYPEEVNRRRGEAFDPWRAEDHHHFTFGMGPRACPARRVSLALCEALLARYRALGVRIEPGYHHRRSLAQPVAACIAEGVVPAPAGWGARARAWTRYGRACAASYPSAFLVALPELAGVIMS
jgi:cytochrome P450